MGWAADEFSEVNLGDKRLDSRLIKVCDSLSEAPESSINQACKDWHETKAAYRFFQNTNVNTEDIMNAHYVKTAARAESHPTILAIQDTSFFVYTNHPKTKGLGKLFMTTRQNNKKTFTNGLMMHTCFAVTVEGMPLGLLYQKIVTRKIHQENEAVSGNNIQHIPVEKKESYRWIETLKATSKASNKCRVVTVCDRECDFYDFFKAAHKSEAYVLVRASKNRIINKSSRYAQKDSIKLWDHIASIPLAGSYTVEISAVKQTKSNKGRTARKGQMDIKFGTFEMNPPHKHLEHKAEVLPDIQMYAIHALERNPPEGEAPVEWMLLSNLPVTTLEEACDIVYWYSLRWRIEMYFKVLKSGFRVESCRLGTVDRLMRYLNVMSIVAWRLFMITLIARTNPSLSCSLFLSEQEWKVLAVKLSRTTSPPDVAPTISEAVIWIARLGGYLARKSDGPPGTLALWKGWKRLTDLTEGWSLANQL